MSSSRNESKSDRKTIWLYAAILFSSAFIILLLTAYSQVKLQNNKSEYENQISSEQKEKESVILNLNTISEENKKLKQEIENFKNSLNKASDEKANYDSKYKELEKIEIKQQQAYEKLMEAVEKFYEGNIVESAILLYDNKDYSVLGTVGINTYNEFVNRTYRSASKLLYIDGYSRYIEKDYETSISLMQNSVKLSENEYFSDDCYYYIAYSKINLGYKEEARQILNNILVNYPDTSYKREIEELLRGL